MKLIIGLGNPGKKYEGTRHNAGFVFVDKLSRHPEITTIGQSLSFREEKRFESLIAETMADGEKIILAKPQTFMNLSGKAVRAIADFYKTDLNDIIVVSDDIDIPVGIIRVRQEGSSGGQKGLQNIIDQLGNDNFTRIRIGIQMTEGSRATTNPNSKLDAVEFVLSKFDKREEPILDEAIDDAIEYILPFISKNESIPAHTLTVSHDSL